MDVLGLKWRVHLKILQLNDIDLLITYSSSFNPDIKWHNLCGHIFEVFDYYFILKKHFKVKCLLPELLNKDNFYDFLKDHYDFENIEDVFPIDDFIFDISYKLIKCKNFLITDGTYYFLNNNVIKLIGNIISFSCGDSYFNKDYPKHVTFLSDRRIYDFGIHYVKKILPNLKHIKGNREFAHITKNCKAFNPENLIKKYPNILIYSDYLLDDYNITKNPIKNFNFNKYIYTPVLKKFDCSPRLIIECKILNIPIEYFEINYFDPGLEIRKNNDVKEFILTENDEIIDIFKNLL